VIREAIMCCRKAGTISVPGVYVGLLDKIPFGAAMNKRHHVPDGPDARAALHQATAGENPIGRHRPVVRDHPSRPARRCPGGLQDKEDGCIKVVLKP
jgi:threonine dehydrogenase-like Zn-dependent dehydrogenase